MNDLIQALLTGNRDELASADPSGALSKLVQHLRDTGFYPKSAEVFAHDPPVVWEKTKESSMYTSSGSLHPKYPKGYV